VPSRFALVLAVAMVTTLAGCGGYIGRAKRDYQAGRYLEVNEALALHEAELDDLPERKQADYGIYRGLALLMMSDYGGAYRWLSYVYALEAAHPGTLRPRQREELDRGWLLLGRALGKDLPPGTVLVPSVPGTAPAPAPAPADRPAPAEKPAPTAAPPAGEL
jgi:hypothetical protein